MTESFTLVFKGDLRKVYPPLGEETQWGFLYAEGIGDYMQKHDVMRKALNEIAREQSAKDGMTAADKFQAIARKALDEVKS